MANARFQVIELYDDATDPRLPRYVSAQRQGESAWRITWANRDKLPGKLATWFREMASQGREPAERVVLGRGVGLTMKTAFALARFRIAEINRMATGDPDQMADFLCFEPPCRGGRGHNRPVVVVGPEWRAEAVPERLRDGASGAHRPAHGGSTGSAGAAGARRPDDPVAIARINV